MNTLSLKEHVAPERAFRDALGLFGSGVVIAAADDGYRAHGLTVASFCSVSLKPQLCLLCISDDSPFISVARGVNAFSVHVLAASQMETARIFAYSPPEERVTHLERRVDAPPIVPGSLAGFDFQLHAEHPGGDHRIIVGELTGLRVSEAGGAALGWARGALGPLKVG